MGLLAITTHHDPLTLNVRHAYPVFTDPHATVAWSGSLEPTIKTDVSLKTLVGRGSGESIQLCFEGEGFVCTAEQHLDEGDNFAFSNVAESDIERMIQAVADSGAEAISIFCTNLRGAGLAERLEEETGVPLVDSVSVTVWRSLLLAGADPGRITGWGQLFRCVSPPPAD